MRAVIIALLLLGVCSQARAGIYNPVETPLPYMTIGENSIVGYIFGLRAIPFKPKKKLDPDSPRAVNLRYVDYYEPMRKAGTLATTDAVSLSAAYLRLGNAREAIKVLKAADQEHFLVQANLAGAYQQTGELELARRHQQRALDLWPEVWALWPSQLLDYYRECEKYNLRLMMSRLEESRRPAPKGGLGLDPLFPGVSFVNDDGQYAPGELARKSRDKLPKNAVNLVFQLVAWQPNDRRLCWMLAELLNAGGQVQAAYKLMDNLSDQGFGETELRRHRKILHGGKQVRDVIDKRANLYMLQAELMLIPTPRLGTPVVGDVASACLTLARPVILAPWETEHPPQQGQGPQPADVAKDGSSGFLNLSHVTVSFIFGFLVAALLGLQWQQWQRRRAAAPAPPNDEATANTSTEQKSEAITPNQEGYAQQGRP